MPTGSGILRLARGRSSAIDLDTEEGRAFLQERLAFYNKVCFLISGSFFLISALLMASGLEAPDPVTREHVQRAVWLHAATLVVQLLAWVGCAQGPRLGTRWLRAIDAGALALVCVGFSLQVVSMAAPHVEPVGPFPRVTLLLILTHSLVARAVFVPSPTLWTVAVSTAAALPVTAAAGFAPARDGAAGAAAVAIWMGLWALCAVVVAALTSQLVYGLREQVREAKRLGQYTLEREARRGRHGRRLPREPRDAAPADRDQAAAAREGGRAPRSSASSARCSSPRGSRTRTRWRSSTTAARRTESSTTRWNTSTASTSDTLVRVDGPQPPGRVVHVLRQVAVRPDGGPRHRPDPP